MSRLISYTSCILLLTTPFMVQADSGEKLHNDNCIACHQSIVGGDGTGLYTRENHTVKSLAGLKQQVTRCKTSVGLAWSDTQINAVTNYLNKQFYKFPAKHE